MACISARPFPLKQLLSILLFCTSAPLPAQPAVSIFTDHPAFEDVKISPKGTYLAFTQKGDNKEFLIVVLAEDLSAVSAVNFGSDTDVQQFDWVNDERILMSPGRAFEGQLDYKQATGEIFGIDADGKNFEILFGYQAGNNASGRLVQTRQAIVAAGDIVDLLPDDPDQVIVQSIGYGVAGEFNEAWRMNVDTGRLAKLSTSPVRNGRFITDANHEIRFLIGVNNNNKMELYTLDEKDKWQLAMTEEDANWVYPVGPWGQDGKMLARTTSAAGMQGYSIWDPSTGDVESLFHHDTVDAGTLFLDNDKRYWAIEYHDHFPEYFYPDETHPFVKLHKQLRASSSALNVRIVDETDALDKVIVYVSSPQHPGDFLVLDTASMQFKMRLSRHPRVPREILSRMDPIEFTARDGEVIRGFLTVPNGDDKQLPLVVLPHGGPHGIMDIWSYNFETQLLASRGYAVLQVNFRGSSGRGVPFEDAGYGEWGGKMQDDLTDATRWAITDGVADPNRICIMGASYGAYAALTGAYKEPELYKCAIGISGVYDLNLMFSAGDIADAARGLSFLKEVLGDDKDLLASRSPVANADKITAEVMLIHGEQDERAPVEHAKRMREALEKQGKKPIWFTKWGESHGIMSDENRVTVYGDVLDFLATNIGPQQQ